MIHLSSNDYKDPKLLPQSLILYLRVHYIQAFASHHISIRLLLRHLIRLDPIVRKTNMSPRYADRLRKLPSRGNGYYIRQSKNFPLYFLDNKFRQNLLCLCSQVGQYYFQENCNHLEIFSSHNLKYIPNINNHLMITQFLQIILSYLFYRYFKIEEHLL